MPSRRSSSWRDAARGVGFIVGLGLAVCVAGLVIAVAMTVVLA